MEIPVPLEVISEKQVDIIAILKKYAPKVKFSQNRITIVSDDAEMRSRLSTFDQYLRIRM